MGIFSKPPINALSLRRRWLVCFNKSFGHQLHGAGSVGLAIFASGQWPVSSDPALDMATFPVMLGVSSAMIMLRGGQRGRKPTPRIEPSYSRSNPGRYLLSRTRRACKKGKPGHMSEPGRSLLLKPYPSSEASKPKCALDRSRSRHNTNAPQAILIQVGIGSCASRTGRLSEEQQACASSARRRPPRRSTG